MVVKTLIEQIDNNSITEQQRRIITKLITQLFSAMADGDSCIRLDSSQDLELLLNSGLAQAVSPSVLPTLPLCIYQVNGFNYLYLTRYYYYEYSISRKILQLAEHQPEDESTKIKQAIATLAEKYREFDFPNLDQFRSIKASLYRKFSIITGGPGTGKTTSVIFILWSLFQVYGNNIRILVAAPTGKAAKRVKESLQHNLEFIQNNLNLEVADIRLLLDNRESFATIHKILGYQHHSIYFKHNHEAHLATDVLIVDESSMVSLPLFQKLLSAVNAHKLKHLILLGDSNQLSSVEEGFVFNSLVHTESAADYLSTLLISRRNHGDVGRLAQSILDNDLSLTTTLLKSSGVLTLKLPTITNVMNSVLYGKNNILEFIKYCQKLIVTGQDDIIELFKYYTRSAVLCMTNSGKLGVDNLNSEIEQLIKIKLGIKDRWYSGKSIIILNNEKSLNLFNGDIGVCLMVDEKPRIYFDDGRSFVPEMLPKHQSSFAITIHKSQGSEYEMVRVVIPSTVRHNLLSKELFYTAITRAKTAVEIFAEEASIVNLQQTVRTSALQYLLNIKS